MTTNDFLSFVKLVRQHYREAKIKLTPEIVEKMDDILKGAHSGASVRKHLGNPGSLIPATDASTPENPATLREPDTLRDVLQVILLHHDLCEKCCHLARAVLKRQRAASGTEAAPVCKVPYQVVGGLPGEGTAFCGLPKGHGGRHDQPAQAAASPEGEGRDMPWTPEVEAFRAEMMRRFFNKLTDFSYWSALRQSAAPSGGDLDKPSGGGNYGDRIKEIVADWKSQIAMRADPRDYYQSGVRRGLAMAVSDVEGLIDAVAMTESAPQQLQGESKTGAVTETK